MESYEGFSPVKLDEGPVYNGQTMLGADGAIYTAQYGMDKSRIYAVEEGKARPIAELDGYVSSWAACDGYVVAITRSGFEETDTASFRAVQAEKIRDLQIAVMEVAGQQAGPGTDVCLTLQATNRGYEAITELPVTIACADAKCCTKIPLKWT